MKAKESTNKPPSTLPVPNAVLPSDSKRRSARAPRANAAAAGSPALLPKRKKRFDL